RRRKPASHHGDHVYERSARVSQDGFLSGHQDHRVRRCVPLDRYAACRHIVRCSRPALMSSLGEERVSVCMQDRAFVGHRFTLKGFSPTESEGPKVDCRLRLGTTRELRTRRRRSQAWYAMVPKSEPVAEPTLCPDRWPERAEERRLRGGSARWQPGYPRNPNWVPL